MDPDKQIYFDLLNRIPIDRIHDHPNILVAAGFWEEERYRAAKTCYTFMRKIDDLIDDHKSRHQHLTEQDRQKFLRKAEKWLLTIRKSRRAHPFQEELISTIDRFRIPVWTIENFARSMVYDINHDGFPTLRDFLDYCDGATVAPSSIFVHLCGIRKNGEAWQDPGFDVKSASTPCAIFSYLVHIIRDFRKDQLNNLSYFADDRLKAQGLTRARMNEIAGGSSIVPGFRSLMGEYYLLADDYRKQTWKVLERISPLMEPRYHLSLLIIFNLYLMVFERIDVDRGNFTATELNPTSREIFDRVYRTISDFGHS